MKKRTMFLALAAFPLVALGGISLVTKRVSAATPAATPMMDVPDAPEVKEQVITTESSAQPDTQHDGEHADPIGQ